MRHPWLPFALLLGTFLACSSDDDPEPKACAPGQQIECACPGSATKGAQVCKADGSGYGTCEPCGIGGAGGSGGAGGEAGAPACKEKGDSCFDPDFCCEDLLCTVDKICGSK